MEGGDFELSPLENVGAGDVSNVVNGVLLDVSHRHLHILKF
jgi:hypothetical protein